MKYIVTTLIILLCGSAYAQLDKFKYQPEKIKVGTVYHYTKSGIDGFKPMTVSIYVDSKDGLQVFKTHPGYDDAPFIICDMDWGNFSAKALRSKE